MSTSNTTDALSHDAGTAPLQTTITDLIGLKVYTTNGLYIGEVDDVRLDFHQTQTTRLAITNLNDEAFRGVETGRRGICIPYRWVRAAHDVILVADVVDRLAVGDD